MRCGAVEGWLLCFLSRPFHSQPPPTPNPKQAALLMAKMRSPPAQWQTFAVLLFNFCGFNKENLSFLLFLFTVLLSVLFNNGSHVVSEDEEGRRNRLETTVAGRGLKEGRREKCGADKLILFRDRKEASITKQPNPFQRGRKGAQKEQSEEGEKVREEETEEWHNKGARKRKKKEASCSMSN